jgi:NAD(P)-dependent dehydrogenase (short-subunit alcohol dehydrogenase family)
MSAARAGRLAGKVAVITGAGSGLGAATARRFVSEGARVVVADVQDERGALLAAELGPAAQFVHTNVANEADVAGAVAVAVKHFGTLDIMFNNAGIIGAVGPIAWLSLDEYEYTVAVNLRGTILGMKHAAREMEPRGTGVILSTTSPAAVAGGLGPHVYSAVKAAIIGLTQSVAAELRPKGIRVNAIMPGAMVTAMTADLTTGDAEALDGAHAALAQTALTPRPGEGADIAAAATYLASDEASFVTGETLRVDGGLTTAPGTSPFAQPDYADAALVREAGRRGTAAERPDAPA